MNLIYSHKTAKIMITRIVAIGLTGRTINFVFEAVDSTWIRTRDEVREHGLPVALVEYAKLNLTVEERGEMALAIAQAS